MASVRHSTQDKHARDIYATAETKTRLRSPGTNTGANAGMSRLSAIRLLFGELSLDRHRVFVPLLLLMLQGTGAEVVTIGDIVPVLAFIKAPAEMPTAGNPSVAIYVMSGLLAFAALMAPVLSLAPFRASSSFINGISCELGSKRFVVRYWSLLDASINHLRTTPFFTTVIPSKLSECMASGIPVLHGALGASAHIIEKNHIGFALEPENAQELKKQMEKLADSRDFATSSARMVWQPALSMIATSRS